MGVYFSTLDNSASPHWKKLVCPFLLVGGRCGDQHRQQRHVHGALALAVDPGGLGPRLAQQLETDSGRARAARRDLCQLPVRGVGHHHQPGPSASALVLAVLGR